MHDFSMTLDEKESATVQAWLGETAPETNVSCFIKAESNNKFLLAIEVDGSEKFVVEVSDRGNKIEVTKHAM